MDQKVDQETFRKAFNSFQSQSGLHKVLAVTACPILYRKGIKILRINYQHWVEYLLSKFSKWWISTMPLITELKHALYLITVDERRQAAARNLENNLVLCFTSQDFLLFHLKCYTVKNKILFFQTLKIVKKYFLQCKKMEEVQHFSRFICLHF